MKSFQNLLLLQNLYRLKTIGFDYIDPVAINRKNCTTLPDDIAALNDLIRQCHLCDLSKSRKQSMQGFGALDARIFIVDFYVSVAEDESNDYYVGKPKQMLRKMIENVLKVPLNEVFFTHAVKCKPLGANQPSNSEIQSCSVYLFKQLEIVDPDIVIALGGDAYRILTQDGSDFEKIRGRIIDFGGRKLITIHHPSYIIKNPSKKRIVFDDLTMIKALL